MEVIIPGVTLGCLATLFSAFFPWLTTLTSGSDSTKSNKDFYDQKIIRCEAVRDWTARQPLTSCFLCHFHQQGEHKHTLLWLQIYSEHHQLLVVLQFRVMNLETSTTAPSRYCSLQGYITAVEGLELHFSSINSNKIPAFVFKSWIFSPRTK